MKKLLLIVSSILLISCAGINSDERIQKIDSLCVYDTRTSIVYYRSTTYGGSLVITPMFNSKGEPMKYEDYINKKF